MWKLIKYLLLFALVGGLLAPFLLAVALLSDVPVVTASARIDQADVARAKRLFERNDPRQMTAGELRSVALSEDDANLLLGYGLSRLSQRLGERLAGKLDLHWGSADLRIAMELPDNPFGRYMNLRARLLPDQSGLVLDKLHLGVLAVPVDGLWRLVAVFDEDGTAQALADQLSGMVNGVRMTEGHAFVVFQWQPDTLREAKGTIADRLLSARDKARLLAYSERIASVTSDSVAGRLPLLRMWEQLFALAQQRSRQGEAAKENAALVQALGFYLNGVNVPRLLNVADDGRYQASSAALVLRGREDFAQHFVLSATLAVSGGGGLADAVGLFKEVDDSQGGSGFSFNDLAADRAGVRFAQLIGSSDAAARRVQAHFVGGAVESDFMPDVSDLPEFMDELDFKARFGGVGEPRYQAMVEKIEARIARLPIYH